LKFDEEQPGGLSIMIRSANGIRLLFDLHGKARLARAAKRGICAQRTPRFLP